VPKLEDVDPFPEMSLPKGSEGSRGQQIIKTELDQVQNVRFDIVHNFYGDDIAALAPSIQQNWLCGYVTYPGGCPIPPGSDIDVDSYVNVHGGVTYDRGNTDGSHTYGFDCAHAGDSDTACVNDPTWVLNEAKRMHKEIIRLVIEWEEADAK